MAGAGGLLRLFDLAAALRQPDESRDQRGPEGQRRRGRPAAVPELDQAAMRSCDPKAFGRASGYNIVQRRDEFFRVFRRSDGDAQIILDAGGVEMAHQDRAFA